MLYHFIPIVCALLGSIWGALGAHFPKGPHMLFSFFWEASGALWGHTSPKCPTCCFLSFGKHLGRFGGILPQSTPHAVFFLLGSIWGALGAHFPKVPHMLFSFFWEASGALWGHTSPTCPTCCFLSFSIIIKTHFLLSVDMHTHCLTIVPALINKSKPYL